jgi:hypothetical protein
MSDEQILRSGRNAAYMASPAAAYGPVRATFILQLAELRAEWRRRGSESRGAAPSRQNI